MKIIEECRGFILALFKDFVLKNRNEYKKSKSRENDKINKSLPPAKKKIVWLVKNELI